MATTSKVRKARKPKTQVPSTPASEEAAILIAAEPVQPVLTNDTAAAPTAPEAPAAQPTPEPAPTKPVAPAVEAKPKPAPQKDTRLLLKLDGQICCFDSALKGAVALAAQANLQVAFNWIFWANVNGVVDRVTTTDASVWTGEVMLSTNRAHKVVGRATNGPHHGKVLFDVLDETKEHTIGARFVYSVVNSMAKAVEGDVITLEVRLLRDGCLVDGGACSTRNLTWDPKVGRAREALFQWVEKEAVRVVKALIPTQS